MALVHKYKILSKKGYGTFSEVVKALCTKTGRLVAIKRMKSLFRSIEDVNNLREIQALKRLSFIYFLSCYIFKRSSKYNKVA
jgi:renal tumor antigen